jgi:lipid-A-disaccharide synthase
VSVLNATSVNLESSNVSGRPLKVALVAGEASGDILGEGLMKGLKSIYPDIEFYGIGGPLMIAEGFKSQVSMEKLSVMGLIEVLSHLPELLGIRRRLKKAFIDSPPDIFIGIDAPDFNLGLEKSLKEAGVLTVHYVSPSVWAWKRQRIFKIKKAVDLLLCLFPFEGKYYRETEQKLVYVGHPLAKEIKEELASKNKVQIKKTESDSKTVAILPGSRSSETKYLLPVFLEAASILYDRNKRLQFVIPAANQKRYDEISHQLEFFKNLPVKLILGHSRQTMSSSDVIMIASGTATLEAALLGKPMVVAYKMARLTYALYSRMLHTQFVSLPNILVNEAVVPELLQDDATPKRIAEEIDSLLFDSEKRAYVSLKFTEIQQILNVDSNTIAANAVKELLNKSSINKGNEND